MNNNIKIAGIFLAAGSSKRMGKANKLLLPYCNTTLVHYTYLQFKQSEIDEHVVVTGYQHQQIENALATEKPNFVHNVNYATGMTSSIQTGFQFLKDAATGYMVALSDMPHLTKKEYDLLIAAFKKNYTNKALIIVPVINQQQGNPVIFSKEFVSDILKHQNKEGCKLIIQKNNTFVKLITLDNENSFKDIDEQADYLELSNV